MNPLTVHILHVVVGIIVSADAEAHQQLAQKLTSLQTETLVVIAHHSLIAIMDHISETVLLINNLLTMSVDAITLDAVTGFQGLNKNMFGSDFTKNIFYSLNSVLISSLGYTYDISGWSSTPSFITVYSPVC